MPDQLHCFNCDYTWFPRYKKSSGLRKCPNCGVLGEYEVLSWWQQGNTKYYGKGRTAGEERTGCGCFVLLIFILVAVFSILSSLFM